MEFYPATYRLLPDFMSFSCQHGKFRWGSCMRWRMSSSEYRDSTKEEREANLTDLVCAGTPVGILGYSEGKPMAWCSVAPRETYVALERSRKIPRVDDADDVDDAAVWSVVCFLVDSKF